MSLFDVPCFSCFIQDRSMAARCEVQNCDRLTLWIQKPLLRCAHESRVKQGFYKYKGKKVQRYTCKNCGVTFRLVYARDKYSNEVIEKAIALRDQGYSLRKIAAELEKTMDAKVSYGTVSKWLQK